MRFSRKHIDTPRSTRRSTPPVVIAPVPEALPPEPPEPLAQRPFEPRSAVELPEQLIAALSHEAWDVRQLAAELIGEHAIERARPALAAQLAREHDDLAKAAISEALRALAEEVR